jgi:hypothetical protein
LLPPRGFTFVASARFYICRLRDGATYSNYAEAQRAFWRQTVLPVVDRNAKAIANWLSPAFGAELELRPDLDQVEALSPEREALWTRLQSVSFLTDDEKRIAIGYGPKDRSPAAIAGKYRDDQPRVSAGQSGGGQWTSGGASEETRIGGAGIGRKPPPNAQIILASKKGGVAKALWKLTVRQFVSQYCKGEINREMPDEFSDLSIEDVFDLAKGGDARARKCQKLINQGRFRK